MSIKIIQTQNIAEAKGHYSPAIVHNNTVYVAGQLPIDKQGEVQIETIEAQTALCMENIKQILLAANSDLDHILKVNVFVSDIVLWPRINAEYAKIMGNHKPARIVVPCNTLNYGCQIEIDCIAAVKSN
jgi:2-iminobutanoate/2-iminopropanoate deaminase